MKPEYMSRFEEQNKISKPLTQEAINSLKPEDKYYVDGREIQVGDKVIPVFLVSPDKMEMLKLRYEDLNKFDLVLHPKDTGKSIFYVTEVRSVE